MEIIDEKTGLSSYKLKLEYVDSQVRVSILGPRGGEKAFVYVRAKDLLQSINREVSNSR